MTIKVTIEVTIGGDDDLPPDGARDLGRLTLSPLPWEDLPTRLQIAEHLRRLVDMLEEAPVLGTPEWNDWLKTRPYAQLDLSNVVFVDENDRMRLALKTRLPSTPPPRR